MSKAREQRNKKAYELYMSGKKQHEIASILGISQPTVSQAIQSYRKHLNSIDIFKQVIDDLKKAWGFESNELEDYYLYSKKYNYVLDPLEFKESVNSWMNSSVPYYQEYMKHNK